MSCVKEVERQRKDDGECHNRLLFGLDDLGLETLEVGSGDVGDEGVKGLLGVLLVVALACDTKDCSQNTITGRYERSWTYAPCEFAVSGERT